MLHSPAVRITTELTEISTGMTMDVGTSASTCFGIVNVRTAIAREGHFRGERQKMTVLEQRAFTDKFAQGSSTLSPPLLVHGL